MTSYFTGAFKVAQILAPDSFSRKCVLLTVPSGAISQSAVGLCFFLPVQYEPDLEGHAAPGGENIAAGTPQRHRLEEQRRGPQR